MCLPTLIPPHLTNTVSPYIAGIEEKKKKRKKKQSSIGLFFFFSKTTTERFSHVKEDGKNKIRRV